MRDNAYAVILAGGYGERFWPSSTSKRPKQLLSLLSDQTMLGMAVDRLEGLIPPERIIVLTNGGNAGGSAGHLGGALAGFLFLKVAPLRNWLAP